MQKRSRPTQPILIVTLLAAVVLPVDPGFPVLDAVLAALPPAEDGVSAVSHSDSTDGVRAAVEPRLLRVAPDRTIVPLVGQGGRGGPPGVLVYSNEVDPVVDVLSIGAGIPVADDLTLLGGGCDTVYYDLAVLGEVGEAPFTVNVELRSDPCDPGTVLATSQQTFVDVPSDGVPRVFSATFDPGIPVSGTVWMVAEFSTNFSGWVVAGLAEIGVTADTALADHPVLGCVPFDFGGAPWAGFWANIRCGCQTDADCDDGDPCSDDQCVGGACTSSPVDCTSAGNQCNDASCDPLGPDGNCDVLTPIPDGTVCDDGDACTTSDECTAGTCAGAPIVCDDGLFCNGVETCAGGACVPGSAPCQAWEFCDEVTDLCEGCGISAAGTDSLSTDCGITVLNMKALGGIPGLVFGSDFRRYEGIIQLRANAAQGFSLKWNRLGDLCSAAGAPLELQDVQLLSCSPILVQRESGTFVFFDVEVTMSTVVPPLGSLVARKEHANGGTFTAELFVQPRFKFQQSVGGAAVAQFDAGEAGRPPIRLQTVGRADWVGTLAPGVTSQPLGADFYPGVREDPSTLVQCCEKFLLSGPGAHIELEPPGCTLFCQRGACCFASEPVTCDDTLNLIDCQNAGGQFEEDWPNCDDADGDALVDYRETFGPNGIVEECHTGTNPLALDTDDDGCDDGQEIGAGTDPLDPCDSSPSCVLPIVGDCNGNGIADNCDIAGGTSQDCNNNDVDDDCESGACCVTSVSSGTGACVVTSKDTCDALVGVFRGPCADCAPQSAGIAFHDGVLIVHTVGTPVACDDPGGRGAVVCDPLDRKIDAWVSREQDEQNPLICHDFGSPAGCGAIPAGFFGELSDPFDGLACLQGVPLGPTPPFGDFGDADTLVERWGGPTGNNGDPFARCSLPSGAQLTETVNIRIVALSLAGQITVTFNGGKNPSEDWDVAVDLSEVAQQDGILTANKTHCNGGTYTSTLPVIPRFTFTKAGDPSQVLDLGLVPACDPVILQMNPLDQDPATWVHDLHPDLGSVGDPCSEFHGAIDDSVQVVACDCEANGIRDKCDIENCPSGDPSCQDCNANGVPDGCDIDGGAVPDCNGNGVPDDCEPDCQPNGVADECDIAGGSSADCNGNAIPDDCEFDCDGNNVPDDCDIAQGVALDLDQNGIPDNCFPPALPPCLCGDFNQDGSVNLLDFAQFSLCFGGLVSAPGCECTDLNQDGVIRLDDFATFALLFGRPWNGSSPPACN